MCSHKRFYLLTEIFQQQKKIKKFNRLPTKIENFNRQPTSGPPPHSDPQEKEELTQGLAKLTTDKKGRTKITSS